MSGAEADIQGTIEQSAKLRRQNRMLKQVVISLVVLLFAATLLIALTIHSASKKSEAGKFAGLLHQGMTMSEVEQLLGKADRVDVQKGKATSVPGVDGNFELPEVIRWVYSRYKITESGEDYGKPGHINFVPARFTERGRNDPNADRIAREYGEQADTYRTFSYRGSFPVDPSDWDPVGPLDGIPSKEIKK